MLKPGQVLSDRYRIEKILGEGGMGAVYLARISALADKPVAIKQMKRDANDARGVEKAAEQFQKEASMVANLDHPNLVPVTDFFSDDDSYFLVMAYIEGATIEELMARRSSPYPLDRILDWAEQLCDVLDYLHSQNPPILFRDLKPSNIMVDNNDRIRLIDFGIARSFTPGEKTGTFLQGIGSHGYSPLEQYAGAGSTDPRSDIYSLGATLYHVLTCTAPPSPIEVVSQRATRDPLRRTNPQAPPSLEPVINKMMEVRQEDRYRSMREVKQVLSRIRQALNQNNDATDDLGTGVLAAAAVAATGPVKPAVAQPSAPPVAAPATSHPTIPVTRPAESRGGVAVAGLLVLGLLGLGAWGIHKMDNTPSSTAAAASTAVEPTKSPAIEVVDEMQPKTAKLEVQDPKPKPTKKPAPDYVVTRTQPKPAPTKTVTRVVTPPSPKPAQHTAAARPVKKKYPTNNSYPRARKTEEKPEAKPVAQPSEPIAAPRRPVAVSSPQPQQPQQRPGPPPGYPPHPHPGMHPPPPPPGAPLPPHLRSQQGSQPQRFPIREPNSESKPRGY